MTTKKIPRSFGTHDGSFHADEVTACALLLNFNLIDWDKIVRTRDLKVLEECEYICDVGGVYNPDLKLFDHHQADYHDTMSSAGMILLYLKKQGHLTPKEYDFLKGTLVAGVDDHDNGRDPLIPGVTTYSHIIASFVPYEDATPKELQNAAFMEALQFSVGLLRRLHHRYQYTQECREIVKAAMERDKECLVFDKYIPWLDVFFELGGANHPALFIIMPSGDHWKLRGVPPSLKEKMKVRLPLPQEWAGLLEEELKRTTGIPGAIFCHKGRFISVWETKKDAEQALKYILSQAKGAS